MQLFYCVIGSYNSVKLVWLKTAKVSYHKIIQDGENSKVSCLETFLFYSIMPQQNGPLLLQLKHGHC